MTDKGVGTRMDLHVGLAWADHFALTQLQAAYASSVDAADWAGWCELFTDDCVYTSCRARTMSAACRWRPCRSRARAC